MNAKLFLLCCITAVFSSLVSAQDDLSFFKKRASEFPRLEVWESSPSWVGEEELVFFSPRNLIIAGKEIVEPEYDSHGNMGKNNSLVLYSPKHTENQLRILLTLDSTGTAPAWCATGNKIAFSAWTKIGLLYIDASSVSAVNKNRVFRFDASWSPDGKRLVMSGTHSPSDMTNKKYEYDQDIFVSAIKTKPEVAPLLNNRCIVRLPGVDKLPVFDLQGQWVYFAHHAYAKEPELDVEHIKRTTHAQRYAENCILRSKKNWSLLRVRADKSWNENNLPEEVVSGLSEPNRLSFFPDGKRILVSFDSEYQVKADQGAMAIVDIKAKKATPYKLKLFKDPNYKTLLPLIPEQVTLSPNGKKLAFRALLWDGKPYSIGWLCIYTCDFSGDNLKRITPTKRSPLPPYIYKDPKLTPSNAYDKAFK